MDSVSVQRRIVEAGVDARRQIARDLHDGPQQRLVCLLIQLRLARAAAGAGGNVDDVLADAITEATSAIAELRELVLGIHPRTLTVCGLVPAVTALTARTVVPTVLHAGLERRAPAEIEVNAYYVIAEALTNVVKHAHATRAEVRLAGDERGLRVVVADDGVGGATVGGGSGLLGMSDRVSALGGTLTVDSPPQRGTAIRVCLPITELAS